MLFRLSFAFLFAGVFLFAGPKKTTGDADGENEDLILTVTVYTDPADIKGLLGNDLGGHYFVADVKVEPKYGKEVSIDRDDFTLRTDKDGEHTHPYQGSQIAGQTALVVGKTKNGDNTGVNESTPTYGDAPIPMGPIMYPNAGVGLGGGGGERDSNKATLKTAADQAPTTPEKLLDQK